MLDQRLGEYLNELFIAGAPLYIGANAIAGLNFVYPFCKKSLPVASLYLKNWQKILVREKALPLPVDLVKAMAAAAIRRGDARFGIALLLGWLSWKPKQCKAVVFPFSPPPSFHASRFIVAVSGSVSVFAASRLEGGAAGCCCCAGVWPSVV